MKIYPVRRLVWSRQANGALLSMAPSIIKARERGGWVLGGGGEAVGVVLQTDDGTVVSLSFRLNFPCSNKCC